MAWTGDVVVRVVCWFVGYVKWHCRCYMGSACLSFSRISILSVS